MRVAFHCFLQARRRRDLGATVAVIERQDVVVVPSLEAPDAEKMLAVLAPDERLVMILCYAHGLSHSETADVLEMPLGTVKSHAQRAKVKIRERFQLEADATCCSGRGR